MEGLFEQIASRLEAGEQVFFAVVVDHTDHSPGTAGSTMAQFEDGATLGTIGGGVMERRVQELGSHALRAVSFHPRREVLVHREHVSGASGLVCAGQQTNVYLRLGPGDAALAREVVAAREEVAARKAVAAREAQDANRADSLGAKPRWLLVSPQGLSISHTLPPSLDTPKDSWVYAEPLLNPRRLLILGGGHCALALSRVARLAGFHVTVADDRAHLTTFEENRAAHSRLSVQDLTEAAGLVTHPELTSVVAMGKDIESDVRSLTGALVRPFPFLGLMGAPAKVGRIRKALAEAGFGPEAWKRITAPVGLAIGSRTPEEIAISVTAQLVQLHRLPDVRT